MTDAPAGGASVISFLARAGKVFTAAFFEAQIFSLLAAWYSRNHAEFAHIWLREQLSDIVRSLWPQPAAACETQCFEAVKCRCKRTAGQTGDVGSQFYSEWWQNGAPFRTKLRTRMLLKLRYKSPPLTAALRH